jgi:soluble lytic murein transglycosylase
MELMKLFISSCLFLTYLSAQAFPAYAGAFSRDVHVWRGEYEHALSSNGGELDDPAYLTLAGEVDSALEILGASRDSLRCGLLSFRAGRFSDAVGWLECELDNSYLESFRLMHRALALQAESRHSEALVAFGRLVRLEQDTGTLTMTTRASDLIIEASYRSGGGADSLLEFLGGREDISGRSSLFLAAMLLDGGREMEAAGAFIRGIGATPDSTSLDVFDSLFDRFMNRLAVFELEDVIAMTEAAISAGKRAEALSMIEYIASTHPEDYRAVLLKGSLLRSERKLKRALQLHEQLFRSEAPVSVKKEALLEIASIEYSLKLFARSASSYRTFGLYYPTDHRSAYALDVAARIFVARERYDDGLRTWERLRKRGLESGITREAALSESVLRYMRGDLRGAREILRSLLAAGDEDLEPAILYWLYRTGGPGEDRDALMKRLLAEHPLSFYSIASRGEASFFTLKEEDLYQTAGRLIERLERREREFVESVGLTLRPGEMLCQHAAYEALSYFLERGFIEEARICVGELARTFGSDTAGMAALYATVRSSGLVDVGLKLLWTKGLSIEGSPVHYSLRYPVAYSGSVSREAERNRLPAELILAIIREESSFDRFAVSRAGALGLMQLMPRTGAWIGGMIDEGSYSTEDLLHPSCNIAAGSWYLRYLLGRFDDSIVAALAAYNGGETRLKRWRRLFRPSDQPIAALELIGPRETRRYVKKVLDTMAVYRAIALYDPEF